jgi:hypothetical protein
VLQEYIVQCDVPWTTAIGWLVLPLTIVLLPGFAVGSQLVSDGKGIIYWLHLLPFCLLVNAVIGAFLGVMLGGLRRRH